MPRQKYAITQTDFRFARQYLSRKLNEDYDWLAGSPLEEDSGVAGERDFHKIRKPEELTEWGEQWLSREQWEQLKTAIRAARKRRRDQSGEGTKHLTVSWRAWSILHDLAKRDGVTISEVIVSRLGGK